MDKCEWKYDDQDGSWDTSCGEKHLFITGGPIENGHKGCPYCIKPLFVGRGEPEILDVEKYVDSIRSGRDFMLVKSQALDLAKKMDLNGQRKLYYQGGYKDMVESVRQYLSWLEIDGAIAPLDVKIKKAFDNIKLPE